MRPRRPAKAAPVVRAATRGLTATRERAATQAARAAAASRPVQATAVALEPRPTRATLGTPAHQRQGSRQRRRPTTMLAEAALARPPAGARRAGTLGCWQRPRLSYCGNVGA